MDASDGYTATLCWTGLGALVADVDLIDRAGQGKREGGKRKEERGKREKEKTPPHWWAANGGTQRGAAWQDAWCQIWSCLSNRRLSVTKVSKYQYVLARHVTFRFARSYGLRLRQHCRAVLVCCPVLRSAFRDLSAGERAVFLRQPHFPLLLYLR